MLNDDKIERDKQSIKKHFLVGSFVKHYLMGIYTNSSITKIIVQGKAEGKRGRGRPKISYMENVRQWTVM